jgi:hypothetical protein
MTEGDAREGAVALAGLCADCAHARRIESARGSAFYLCELSASDPSYAKYPSLPVIQCAGYEQKIESS